MQVQMLFTLTQHGVQPPRANVIKHPVRLLRRIRDRAHRAVCEHELNTLGLKQCRLLPDHVVGRLCQDAVEVGGREALELDTHGQATL